MCELQIPDHLLLVLQQAKENYQLPEIKRKPGKPPTYSDRSFLLLSVAAVILRTFDSIELHRLLSRDMALRTACLLPQVPHRKTIARRLSKLIPAAEEQIRLCGRGIIAEVALPGQPLISAIDGRMYEAAGAKWHAKHRRQDIIPVGVRNVDTESYWSKSDYRGWVQGYRLIVQTLCFPVPVPLSARWTGNEAGEATTFKQMIARRQLCVTDTLLADETFGSAGLVKLYGEAGGWLLTPKQLPRKNYTWKDDLFAYRKETIELLFQRIIQASDLKTCQVKGNGKNGAFVLASVWLYQIIFLTNHRQRKSLANVKEQVDLARWRVPI
jgi:hypothetical protein